MLLDEHPVDIDIGGDYNVITVDQRGVYAASATIDVTNAYGPAYNVEVTQQTDTSAKRDTFFQQKRTYSCEWRLYGPFVKLHL